MPTDTTYLPAIFNLARKATTLRPYVAKNWRTLAQQLLQADEVDNAIATLIEAISKLPTDPALYLMLAHAYSRAGRSDRAREVLHQTPTVPADDRELIIFHLQLLMKTRAVKDIAQIAADTLALDPTNLDSLRALAQVSRQRGNPEIIIPYCEAALKLEPGHTSARYHLAVAFAMLGRSEEARRLIDLDKFVEVTQVTTPEGYANAEVFEAALADEIARNPTLKPDPISTATESGFQTTRFPQAGDQATVALLDLIRSTVDAFEVNLSEGLNHPFVETRPKRARLNAWAVVYPSDGHQSSHIHPEGWLSGVYYVSAPEATCDNQRSGCLVLGALDSKRLGDDPPWGTRDIRPVPGRLVLFPSYVPHAVIPTKSNDSRICIAFDVIPSKVDLPSTR